MLLIDASLPNKSFHLTAHLRMRTEQHGYGWVAIGDRAAAVRCAEQHANLLRTELGLPPDPKVVRMIDQLRDGSVSG